MPADHETTTGTGTGTGRGTGSGTGKPGKAGKPSRREQQADTAAALARRLSAAEAELGVPDGLWERISDSARPTPVRVPAQRANAVPLTARRPVRTLVVAVAAVAVAFVALGTWWLASPSSGPWPTQKQPATGPSSHTHAPSVSLRVHNSEKSCRRLHTLECAMRLAKDPYKKYATGHNTAGRVWHGDRVKASCVVVDGRMVRDERGVTSRRWYKVRTPHGADGWLPGVRTRNSTEVPVCTAAER